MDQEKVFKSAMFGFQKKGVLSYLYKLDEDAQQKEKAHSEELKKLSTENGELSAQVKKLEEEYRLLNDKLVSERENAGKSSQMIGALTQEVEKQRDIISDRENKIKLYMAQNNELAKTRADQQEKLKDYDCLKNRVGDLIIEAQNSAENIIQKANEKAEQITREASASSKSVHTEFVAIKEDVAKIKVSTKELISAIAQNIVDIEELVNAELTRFEEDGRLSNVVSPSQEAVDFSDVTEVTEEEASQPIDKPYIGSFFRNR